MSSSVGGVMFGLGLEPQVKTLAAGASGNPSGKIQQLPVDCFSRLFSYLSPNELALAERVNRSWNGMISSKDQDAWKEQCSIQGLLVGPYVVQALSSYSSKEIKGQFTTAIFSLITDYAEVDYKKKASDVHLGRIELRGCMLYTSKDPQYYHRWGNDNRELFASIQVSSPIENPKRYFERRIGRCWTENPPVGVESLPRHTPLRLFINKDGSYKNNDDKVKVIWKGKRLILTCTHRPKYCVGNTFREAIEKGIEESLSKGLMTQASLQQAQATAAISGEWISSD